MTTLDKIAVGERVRVFSLGTAGEMRRRLLDLGVVEGTVIECVGRSPLGDPSAFLLRGAVVALRKDDTAKIYVERGGADGTH